MQYGSIFGAASAGPAAADQHNAYRRLLVAVKDIDLSERVLGEGFSGKVYLAHLRPAAVTTVKGRSASALAARPVALKVIAQSAGAARHDSSKGGGGGDASEAVLRCALLEARLHARLDHPNLVRLLAVQEERQPVMLALELCEHGSLIDTLRQRASGSADFDASQRRDIAAQAAAGLRYLHSKLCIHRDVAARNMLVASPGAGGGAGMPPACGFVIKLSDLGLARQLRTEADYYKVSRWGGGGGGGRERCGGGGVREKRERTR